MTERVTIVIPAPLEGHFLLQDCVANVKATTGMQPVVWETAENVAVARNQAMEEIKTPYICFLDSDAFPQEKDWVRSLVEVADKTRASIVSPVEVLDFGESRVAYARSGPGPTIIRKPSNCAGMCLLVRRAAGRGRFDPNLGLTCGRIGPCIEDTDFACAIREFGGTHAYHHDVHVLHKDRGTSDMDSWVKTDEFLAYGILSDLIQARWRVEDKELRRRFFDGIGWVPSKTQRMMAPGFTYNDLLECYLPILDKLPEQERKRLQHQMEAHIRTRMR